MPFPFDPASWSGLLLAALVVVLVATLAHALLRPVLRRVASFSTVLHHMVQRCDRPTTLALPSLALLVLWQAAPPELPGLPGVQHATAIVAIAALTWLLTAAIRGIADGVIARHPSHVADNLQARRIQTQTRVLSRTASGAVTVAGFAFILMTFPRARQLGASLLASAGVAGLIAGIAARSVFSNLLAGLQIAMAQPIRIDDVLIVEGEWGRVEEITSTYVVLSLWDERRLIVPLQWFIEHPFQNWTRRSADLIGTVFLWVDYTQPLEPLRREARRLCEGSPRWDGRVCLLQVTDADPRGMQLRLLVSSASSGENWDLRCEVREGLVAFLQREHPQSLPRLRASLQEAAAPATERPRPGAEPPAPQPRSELPRRDTPGRPTLP